MNQEATKKEAHSIISDTLDLQMSLSQSSSVQVSAEALRLLNDIQRAARSILTGNGGDDLKEDDQVVTDYRQDMLSLMVNLGQMLPAHQRDEVSDEDLPEIALACEVACGRIRNYMTVKNVKIGLRKKQAQQEEEAQHAVA